MKKFRMEWHLWDQCSGVRKNSKIVVFEVVIVQPPKAHFLTFSSETKIMKTTHSACQRVQWCTRNLLYFKNFSHAPIFLKKKNRHLQNFFFEAYTYDSSTIFDLARRVHWFNKKNPKNVRPRIQTFFIVTLQKASYCSG